MYRCREQRGFARCQGFIHIVRSADDDPAQTRLAGLSVLENENTVRVTEGFITWVLDLWIPDIIELI